MKFAERLKELRLEKEMQQTELAEMLNLRSSAISKYEKGITQPSIETLIKLSEIFEVTIDYLVGVSNEKNPYKNMNLTPAEANLIDRFRSLNYENKIRIDERINHLFELQVSLSSK